jgi:hypothetical protein
MVCTDCYAPYYFDLVTQKCKLQCDRQGQWPYNGQEQVWSMGSYQMTLMSVEFADLGLGDGQYCVPCDQSCAGCWQNQCWECNPGYYWMFESVQTNMYWYY